MVRPIPPTDTSIVLRFGGGIHSRPAPDEIDDRECADGENFVLDLENRDLRNRKPFDLLFTVPNAAEIRGFANLKKTTGEISVLVQAGDTVYSWDGQSTLTSVNTVASTARLRGHRVQNFNLDDVAIITDMQGAEVVLQWDGATLEDVAFTNENGNAFGTFKAKYCYIENERVVFGNVADGSGTYPHMIVGTKRGVYTQITVNNRPSSSLSDEDPFFLLTPDLKPINGLVEAFGVVAISSEGGSMYRLEGADATDFAITPLYAESAASGDEAVAYVGNDIFYGRQGRLESLVSTDQYGNVESDDLSRAVADMVEAYPGWTLVYNSRLQRIYCFPDGQSEVWLLQKSLIDSGLSPWSKWTTRHQMAFQPTAVMSMLDPMDGLEYVYLGDSSGNVYRLEGSGEGDAGQLPVKVSRLSKLYKAPLDAEYHEFEGWLYHRKGDEVTITIQMEYQGISGYTATVTVPLKGLSYDTVWQGDVWWGGQFYWGVAFRGRLRKTTFDIPGQSDACQVRITAESTKDFEITEIGFRLTGSSKG